MGVAAFLLYLATYYWSTISRVLVAMLAALAPVLMGCVFAYVANIPMSFFEQHMGWMDRDERLARLRRPLSLLAAFTIGVLLASFLLRFIVPELMQSMRMMSQRVPQAVSAIRELSRDLDLELMVDEHLDQLSDWDKIQVQVSEYLVSGAGGLMGSMVSGVSSLLSSTLEVFLSAILALYILMGKERLGRQLGTLVETYLGLDARERLAYVGRVFDHSFRHFIVGRAVVSLLLGAMCLLGMLLLRFPYAMTISTVVGVTYIVPVVGGYVGAIIGGLLIFSISPMQALGFIIFLLVLEQFEANVVFPHVVGSSVGLPGIWVLAAVAVGAGLGGIPFVLLSVPVAASIYQLVSNDIHAREQAAATGRETPGQEAAIQEPPAEVGPGPELPAAQADPSPEPPTEAEA